QEDKQVHDSSSDYFMADYVFPGRWGCYICSRLFTGARLCSRGVVEKPCFWVSHRPQAFLKV
ncbi:unnamed protein product, partial [Heterosigma akashiwo]